MNATVYCPRCGTAVHITITVTAVTVYGGELLVAVLAHNPAHRCPITPQDAP